MYNKQKNLKGVYSWMWSLNVLAISIMRNRKIVWKQGPYCWYFRLNLEYLWWLYGVYIKTAKNGDFCEELPSENDFEAVLVTFRCYDHGAKTSEAVQKIVTAQKEYHKCSLWVIICWRAKIYPLINNIEKWLVTRITSDVAKKVAEVALIHGEFYP